MVLQEPAVSQLVTLHRARIWKLDKATYDYTVSYNEGEPIPGTALFDLTYFCERPFNKLASDYFYAEEGGEPYYEYNRTYTYNDNFKIAQISQTAYEETTLSVMSYDANNNWTGFDFTYPDGSMFKPEVVQNASGQVISYTDESYRYEYSWKRDNLIREDVFVKSDVDASALKTLDMKGPLPVYLSKSRSTVKNFRKVQLAHIRKRSNGFRSNAEDWIRVPEHGIQLF